MFMRSEARLAIVPPIDINTTCGSFAPSLGGDMGRFGISGMMAGPFGAAGGAGVASFAVVCVAGFGAAFGDACAAGFGGGACAAAILTKASDEMIQVDFMYLTSSDL
jgi:hypothetical protein